MIFGGMMKKVTLLSGLMMLILLLTVPVSADQDGNAKWCNIDQYGCYETEADGSTYYIMFWSESARQAIMGNLTAPYTNVVDYCYNCNGRMGLGTSRGGRSGGRGSFPGWMSDLWNVIDKHKDFLNSSYFVGDAESEYQRQVDFYNEGIDKYGVSEEKIEEFIENDDHTYTLMEGIFNR